MLEYIVYDNDNNCFIDETKTILQNGILYRNFKCFQKMKSENLTIFKFSGIKDKNNKKIFVNSSIIKFNYILDMKNITLIGNIIFNQKKAKYEIKLLDLNTPYYYIDFNIEKTYNVKIIDNIQEDKLGLIKELNF